MQRHPMIVATVVALTTAAATLVALTVLPAGTAATSALPAGNLVKNPGAETPVGAVVQSNPPVYPAAWENEEGLKDAKGQPGRPVQTIRYGTHQFVLNPALSKAIGGGKSFFTGGYAGEISTAFQMIDVSSASADIDAGGAGRNRRSPWRGDGCRPPACPCAGPGRRQPDPCGPPRQPGASCHGST